MTSSARFDPPSGIPEGATLTTSYSNGQRASFASGLLDRSSSFREGSDNRTMNSGSTISRGDASPYADMLPMSQWLNLDSVAIGEQKYARCVELKKALGILSSMTTEDISCGAVLHTKPLPPLMLEDLKRLKSSIIESLARARNRAKLFNDSMEKLDKYRHALLSRKRPRNEGLPNERSNGLLYGDRSASGTNSVKMGLQSHQLLGCMDFMSSRSDDKAKTMIPNRRIRSTSMTDNEGRTNTLSRPSGFVEKDREVSRTATGALVLAEEKTQGLSPSDGWEKKMKRKRSVGIAINRALDGDLDHKPNSHQRLGNESRSRPIVAHGFRSVSASTTIGVNKLDGATQPGGLNVRPIQRTEPDMTLDRRERIGGSDKEKATMKGIIKQNARDIHQGGNHPVAKVKASRAPRTGSGSVFNSSATFSHPGGAVEGWEKSSSLSKAQGISAVNNNRKRPASAQSPSPRSSSPPVAQWVGQRPQNSSRIARRTNLVPPVTNKDELQLLPEGIPNADTRARLTTSEANESGPLRRITNTPQQLKLKVEGVPPPGGFSESEDSGPANNLKGKGKISIELDDKSVSSIQKGTHFVMPPKKNNFPTKEELGDVRRQGRTGRGSALSRSCLLLSREKMDIMSTPKHRKSVPDKMESKSGRPPTKKLSDHKASTRLAHVNLTSDLSGEADGDREELATAVNSARNFRYDACKGLFWQQIEPIFAYVTPDDVACLQELKRLAEELENSLCVQSDDQNRKEQSVFRMLTSSPELVFEDKQTVQSNESGRTGSSVDESQDVDTGKLGSERWPEKTIPLSQRLLAALIVDEVGENNCLGGIERDTYQYTGDDSPCGSCSHVGDEPKDMDRYESEIESEGEIKNHKCHSVDNFSCDGSTVSNGFKSPKTGNLMYREELLQEDGIMQLDATHASDHHRINGSQPSQSGLSGITSVDSSYQQMSIDERIMLELQSIGLFPATMPDLAQGENDEINRDISKLKERLLQQVKKNKSQLCKLEMAVLGERELQERDLEHLAMNKLVEIAYKKNRACRGSNASHKSGGSRISRKAAPFARRTLARYRKYKETGISCFRELLFKHEHLSASMCSSGAKCSDGIKEGHIPKSCQAAFAGLSKSEAKGILASDLTIDPAVKRGPHVNGVEKDLADACQSSDQSFIKGESWSDRGKKRELSLDDVVNNVIRSASGGSLPGGPKGKRSEKDRDHNREGMMRNSAPKPGRPAIGTVRGERKTKTKQKTTQLSTSVNGLHGKPVEVPDATLNSTRESIKTAKNESTKLMEVIPNTQDPTDTEAPFDLAHLPLPGMEDLGVSDDLVGQGQDLGTWLALPEDGMQDHDVDFDGLLIPMDDLADVIERR